MHIRYVYPNSCIRYYDIPYFIETECKIRTNDPNNLARRRSMAINDPRAIEMKAN